MKQRALLWVDLKLKETRDSTIEDFGEFFTVRRSIPNPGRGHDSLDPADSPVAIVFDFDYPDRQGLRLMEMTKRRHPSVPVLMVTLQHSEELAVWAFRIGAWEYFAKPVSKKEIRRCCASLARMVQRDTARTSLRSLPQLPSETRLSQSHDHRNGLDPAVVYVQSNYATKISQVKAAELCGMTSFRFSRRFHSTFGVTFQDYVSQFRIARAEELLLNPAVSVSEVAYAVGYSDVSYFGRVFRKRHRMTPSEWRQHELGESRAQLQVEADDPYQTCL